jgi:hypothetical protein
MPGNMITTGSVITCPHGGTAMPVPTNFRVLVDGQPVMLESDIHTVVGCPFMIPATPSPIPSPCVIIRWSGGSTVTKVNGVSVLVQSSVGICYNPTNVPQGTAVIASTQARGSSL